MGNTQTNPSKNPYTDNDASLNLADICAVINGTKVESNNSKNDNKVCELVYELNNKYNSKYIDNPIYYEFVNDKILLYLRQQLKELLLNEITNMPLVLVK